MTNKSLMPQSPFLNSMAALGAKPMLEPTDNLAARGFAQPLLRTEEPVQSGQTVGQDFIKPTKQEPKKPQKTAVGAAPKPGKVTGQSPGQIDGEGAADASVGSSAPGGTSAGLDTSTLSGFGAFSQIAGTVAGPVGLATGFTSAMTDLGFVGLTGGLSHKPSVGTGEIAALDHAQKQGTRDALGATQADNNARSSAAPGGTRPGSSGDGTRGPGGRSGTGETGSGGATGSGNDGDGNRG